MKNINYLFIILAIYGCNEESHKASFNHREKSLKINENLPEYIRKPIDSSEIIEVLKIAMASGTRSLKKDSNLFAYPIADELIKLRVYKPSSNSIVIYNEEDVDVDYLMKSEIHNSRLFKLSDSLYFWYQNNIIQSFTLDSAVFPERWLKKISRTHGKVEKFDDYYTISIPLFSFDHSLAYIHIDHLCCGLCGSGYTLILKKVKDKWRVIDEQGRWVS